MAVQAGAHYTVQTACRTHDVLHDTQRCRMSWLQRAQTHVQTPTQLLRRMQALTKSLMSSCVLRPPSK